MDAPYQSPSRGGFWPSLVLFLLSAGIGAYFLAYAQAPEALASVAAGLAAFTGSGWIGIALGSLLAIGLAVLAIYPPAWPGLRAQLSRLGRRLSFDHKAAAEIQARLRDFESPKDLLDLGRLYLEAERPQQALPLLLRSLELDSSPRAALLTGQAMAAIGQHARAIEAFDHAIAHDAQIGFGAALLGRAKSALEVGAPEDVDSFAARHEKLFGLDLQNQWLRAEAARARGDAEGQGARLRRVLELAPEKPKPAEALLLARARMRARGAATKSATPDGAGS